MPRQTNIQIRRGEESEWTEQNPILDEGELGWDSTNKILKVGTGSNWSNISPIGPNISTYSTNIGDGVESSFTINHNLNALTEIFVTVRNSLGEYVYPDIKYIDEDNVLVEFNFIPSSNELKITVIGVNIG